MPRIISRNLSGVTDACTDGRTYEHRITLAQNWEIQWRITQVVSVLKVVRINSHMTFLFLPCITRYPKHQRTDGRVEGRTEDHKT